MPVTFENFLVWTPSGFRLPDEDFASVEPEGELRLFGKSAGLRARSPAEVMAALEKGLPFSCFDKLRTAMGLSASDLAGLARISIRTIRRRKQDRKLKPDESERIYRIACVFDRAIDVLGDIELARAWFREPLMALSGKTPLEYYSMEVVVDGTF
jgi:putative toxin-antitoxin system antitoxin component (TIGR02293 family)